MKPIDQAAAVIVGHRKSMEWYKNHPELHHLEELCEVSLSDTGLHFKPGIISAPEIKTELVVHLDCIFTRTLNEDLTYNWVSADQDISLTIEAHEFISHAGQAV